MVGVPGQKRGHTYNSLRNLPHYKNLTDEEFEEIFERKAMGAAVDKVYERRIEKKLDEFALEYDVADLKINDKIVLRHLCQAIIAMEDLEQINYKARMQGLDESTIVFTEKLSRTIKELRDDISKMQNDLNITRKIRKSDSEASVLAAVEDVKRKAKQFYDARMAYIICPECKMLLATTWFHWPLKRNTIRLKCDCGHEFTITSKELLENKQCNMPELLPEGLK